MNVVFWLSLRPYSNMVLKDQVKDIEKLEIDFSQRFTM